MLITSAQTAWLVGGVGSLVMLGVAASAEGMNRCLFTWPAADCRVSNVITIAATSSYLGLSALGAGAYQLAEKIARNKLPLDESNVGELGRQLTAEEWAMLKDNHAILA